MTPLPPKQGLKLQIAHPARTLKNVVMTPLPPKQGLKLPSPPVHENQNIRYDTTSTKTRIETVLTALICTITL